VVQVVVALEFMVVETNLQELQEQPHQDKEITVARQPHQVES
jgi:hypothetical protein